MAAPAVTARLDPVGIRLKGGHPVVIAFAIDPDVSFWEVATTPPGIDGGDPVDTTTAHNTQFRTKRPRELVTSGDVECDVQYDFKVLPQIYALINAEGAITVHYPDTGSESFYGYLKSFARSAMKEGEPPTAKITIVVTNWDPVHNVEEGPVTVERTGT